MLLPYNLSFPTSHAPIPAYYIPSPAYYRPVPGGYRLSPAYIYTTPGAGKQSDYRRNSTTTPVVALLGKVSEGGVPMLP